MSMTLVVGLFVEGFGFVAESGLKKEKNGNTALKTCREILLDGILSDKWKRWPASP